jgi:RimJ/RimL family protein N-acetyltransferase
MILATAADRPAIEAFLKAHIVTSMFPLTNLIRYGMDGGHPRAVQFWVRWQAGQITDLVTVTEEGALFPQCPTGPWGDVAVVLADQPVIGLFGEAGQVAALRKALGLVGHAPLDTAEPLYELPLTDLQMPASDGFEIRPLGDAPHPLILSWRAAYCEESLAIPNEDAMEQSTKDIATYLEQDSHRVLLRDGEPVAMTGFNATLPDVVQIGGVYTPPGLRNNGYARTALALHLAEARAKGVGKAVLFAANQPASRAYEALGFRRTGTFSIVIYDEPQVIRG